MKSTIAYFRFHSDVPKRCHKFNNKQQSHSFRSYEEIGLFHSRFFPSSTNEADAIFLTFVDPFASIRTSLEPFSLTDQHHQLATSVDQINSVPTDILRSKTAAGSPLASTDSFIPFSLFHIQTLPE
jgi:hypothetical protein